MSTRKATPRKVLGKIEEGKPISEMSTKKADPRKMLAEFVKNIEEGKGWWFRCPKCYDSGNKGATNDSMHPDCIMPHLGTLFSLEESAMLAMLCQMGCYHKKGKGFAFRRDGWDNLASEFKIPLISWEIATYKLGKYSSCHYIKVGNISMTPQKIYAKFKASPKEYHTPSLSTPQSKALVVISMAQGRRESDAAAEIAANALAEKKRPKKTTRRKRMRR
jgi:hypothetical protein